MLFHPPSSVLLPVPHVQQKASGDCLAACAAMVLTYLGVPMRYEQLLRRLQIKRPIGTAFSMIRELEKF